MLQSRRMRNAKNIVDISAAFNSVTAVHLGLDEQTWTERKKIVKVRATYITVDQLEREDFKINAAFFEYRFKSMTSSDAQSPPIFTVSALSVENCLLESEMFKMDSVRAQDPDILADRKIPQHMRDRLLERSTELRPEFGDPEWKETERACSHCRSKKMQSMNVCSRYVLRMMAFRKGVNGLVRCKIREYCGKVWYVS
ncbi:hypothetical protein H0H87_010639 [Tephrocybe sp. NHM501043]|nr:hypothetical protein H0H87_010639 [Tephrocybe sp. NHM501043]